MEHPDIPSCPTWIVCAICALAPSALAAILVGFAAAAYVLAGGMQWQQLAVYVMGG